MIQNTKCECGHHNAVGTTLCESCGKPLFEDSGIGPLEMRYDGVARRSQRSNPSWIDRVWNFFSSVKVAVNLIIITLLVSILGTLLPQENTFINLDPSIYYKEEYGTWGHIYYLLGLSHTFETWWFRLLLFMIGTSLVICSLDRVLPLYRALSKQQIRKHLRFITRQKIFYEGDLGTAAKGENSAKQWVEQLGTALRKRKYRVHIDGTALLAEKNRFSRWGPYINHIGLIIFLLAVLARGIPGWHMDNYMGFLEGDVQKIPNTSYYLKNEKFTVEFYSDEEMSEQFRAKDRVIPKHYETQAVLYECRANCEDPSAEPILEEVSRQNIIVNKPLSYKGLLAYQFDYRMTPQIISVKPTLKDKQTGQPFGSFELWMDNPQPLYEAGPYQLKLISYFPEFGFDEEAGTPMTISNSPKAPAFIFLMSGPGLAESGETFMYFPRQVDKANFRQDDINGTLGSKFDLSVSSMDDVSIAEYTTYLNIRVDRAIPYIWIGSAIFMIGVIMGFYWQHRRIWVRIDDAQVSIGAHTNKNWYGIRQELAQALGKMNIQVDAKSLDNEVNRS